MRRRWVLSYASVNRRLYRIARSVVRGGGEAPDVQQAAYGLAFTSLREFRGGSSICAWLARIVLNEVAAAFRNWPASERFRLSLLNRCCPCRSCARPSDMINQ